MSDPDIPSEAPAAAPKSSPMPIIIAVVVALVMLGGGFALAYFVLPFRIAAAIQQNAPPAASSDGDSGSAAPALADKPAKTAEKGTDGKSAAGDTDSFVITDILVNIAGTKAGRFLKATAYFAAPPAVVAELEQKRPQITDIVSATLGQKTLDELSDPAIRGKLRSELLNTINPLLETKGEVTNIYFPEFIIQ